MGKWAVLGVLGILWIIITLYQPNFARHTGARSSVRDCRDVAGDAPAYPGTIEIRCIENYLHTSETMLDAFSTYDSTEQIIQYYLSHLPPRGTTPMIRNKAQILVKYPAICASGCEQSAMLIDIDDPIIGITSVNIYRRSITSTGEIPPSNDTLDFHDLE